MLARLARWLRAAGHDTVLADACAPDAALLARAVEEDRWLLTLDRGILEHRAASGCTLLLPQGPVLEQARWLGERLGLDWLARPFSRCLVDNTPLAPAEKTQLAQVPAPVRAATAEFHACPECGRIYWAGSHHRRMQAALADLARA